VRFKAKTVKAKHNGRHTIVFEFEDAIGDAIAFVGGHQSYGDPLQYQTDYAYHVAHKIDPANDKRLIVTAHHIVGTDHDNNQYDIIAVVRLK
jgi:hypothetical protein